MRPGPQGPHPARPLVRRHRPGLGGACAHRVDRPSPPESPCKPCSSPPPPWPVAEIGDKTQLLSLILAAKYRRPWPICLGILPPPWPTMPWRVAVGAAVAAWLSPQVMKWLVAGSFLAVALWTLVPDQADEEGPAGRWPRRTAGHRDRLLPGRNGRQDPGRHGGTGGAIPALVGSGGRHHRGNAAGQCAGGDPRRAFRPAPAAARGAPGRRPCSPRWRCGSPCTEAARRCRSPAMPSRPCPQLVRAADIAAAETEFHHPGTPLPRT